MLYLRVGEGVGSEVDECGEGDDEVFVYSGLRLVVCMVILCYWVMCWVLVFLVLWVWRMIIKMI